MMALWLAVISSALNQLPCVGHIRPGPAWAWWLLADSTESIAAVSAFVSHPPVLLGQAAASTWLALRPRLFHTAPINPRLPGSDSNACFSSCLRWGAAAWHRGTEPLGVEIKRSGNPPGSSRCVGGAAHALLAAC